jgi:dihydropyrimidinase
MHEFGVRRGLITVNQWVELCSTNPARIFGLYPRKGSLLPGADADIVIFDPAIQTTLSVGNLHECVDYTPYEGIAVTGLPMTVLQRGRVLIREREFVAPKGTGQFLRR